MVGSSRLEVIIILMNIHNVGIVKKFCLIIFIILGMLLPGQAQRGWEAGVWMGGSYYFGDLNTSFNLTRPGPAGGVMGRYNFNKRTGLKFSANFGMVYGDDALSKNVYERARNLSFRSTIIEGAGQFEFNFLPYTHGSEEEYFTPYLFAGLSVFSFNPHANYNDEWVALRPLGTEGQFKGEEYYAVSAAVIFGGGLKFDLSYEWSLNIEVAGRHTFTDYLDDVSTEYPDPDNLERLRGPLAVALSDRSGEVDPSTLPPGIDFSMIGAEGRQRGESNTRDIYLMFGVGVLYYFGDVRCPDYGSRKRRNR